MPHDVERTWQLRPTTVGTATAAHVVLQQFAGGERAWRAVRMLLAFIAIAILLTPIPIIHLVGPPLALIAGVVFAVRQYGVTETIRSVEAACPKCGTEQNFFAGFRVGAPKLPVTLTCEQCRKELLLDMPGA